MVNFAERLRSDRESAGFTVRQLAAVSKISFSYITKIENGRNAGGISPDIVRSLAKALQCDELEYLYLSGVVPSPLNELIAEEKSRYFVRSLLGNKPEDAAWERLQTALTSPVKSKTKSSRKTVA